MPEAHRISPSGRVLSPISPVQEMCSPVPVLLSLSWATRCLPLTRSSPTTSTLRSGVRVLRVSASAGRPSWPPELGPGELGPGEAGVAAGALEAGGSAGGAAVGMTPQAVSPATVRDARSTTGIR
jgi:hypothetical protein